MAKYYCTTHPPRMEDLPPCVALYKVEDFYGRRYVPEIDRMALGFADFFRELTPSEIAAYGLIREPREDE